MNTALKPKRDFTEGPLFFRITLFALPIALTGVLQMLYNMADNIVVGKFSGDDLALAAVGCTSALTALYTNLLLGIGAGAGVVIAQSYGAREDKLVNRYIHTAMTFSAIIGIIFMVLGLLTSRWALILMDTKPELLDRSVLYVNIICLGIPATSIYNFGASILRSTGDSKTPLVILSSTGIVNICLNLFFVIVFNMSVDGVAIATISAQYLSAIAVVFILIKKKSETLKLSFSKLKMEKELILKICRYGIPAGIQSSMFSISNIFMSSAINTFPTTTVSAKTIASNIDAISNTAANSFSHATMTFVGQNYGAKKPERIKKSLGYSMLQAVLTSLILGGFILLFAESFAYMFVDRANPDAPIIVATAIEIITIMLSTFFLGAMMECMSGTVKGMGYSLSPMIASISGICVFRMMWIWFVFPTPAMNSVFGLFIVYPISWTITFILQSAIAIIAFKKLNKSLKLPE